MFHDDELNSSPDSSMRSRDIFGKSSQVDEKGYGPSRQRAYLRLYGLWVLYSATRRRKIILHRKFLIGSGLASSTIASALNKLQEDGLISPVRRGIGKAPVIYLKSEKEVFEESGNL